MNWTGTLTPTSATFDFPGWPPLVCKVSGTRGEPLCFHTFTQEDRAIRWASGSVSADRKRFSLLLEPVLIEGDCRREGAAYALVETGYSVRKGYVWGEGEMVMGEKV